MKKICAVAAKWWKSKLEVSPKSFFNRDLNPINLITAHFAYKNSPKYSSDNASIFKGLLEKRIQESYTNIDGTYNHHFGISVDYDPDKLLTEIAKASSIPLLLFPWKTDMIIGKRYIMVKEGFDGSYRLIYPFKLPAFLTPLIKKVFSIY